MSTPPTPAFVVADAHGNARQVLGLLASQGLPRKGVTVVQLGDLANCVLSSEQGDMDALSLVGGAVDLMLVGNHEHPHFGGPAFSGFFGHASVKERLHSLNERGLLQPSVAIGGALITHAGVSVRVNSPTHYDERRWITAEEADEELRWAWRHHPTAPVFSDIGWERGGSSPGGGILWADWREPKTLAFRQLVGHTVGEQVRRRDRAICIDLGGGKGTRIAGAWVGRRIRPVIYDSPEEVAA